MKRNSSATHTAMSFPTALVEEHASARRLSLDYPTATGKWMACYVAKVRGSLERGGSTVRISRGNADASSDKS